MKLKIEFEAESLPELIKQVSEGLKALEGGFVIDKDVIDETPVKEAPKAKKGPKAKAAAKEPDEDFDLPSSELDESDLEESDDDGLGDDESSDDGDTPSLDLETDVLPAFNDFVKRQTKKLGTKEKALAEVKKILTAFKVKNVRHLKEEDFEAAMKRVAK